MSHDFSKFSSLIKTIKSFGMPKPSDFEEFFILFSRIGLSSVNGSRQKLRQRLQMGHTPS